MDFEFSQEQLALRDLARQILAAEVTPEALKRVEASGDGFDAGLWAKLAEANLLGLGIPEELGGAGFGLLEVCVLLQEVGRALAPVPVLSTLLLGAAPIARYGTPAQRERWLPALARGEALLSAGLAEPGGDDPGAPAARALRRDAAWRLEGEKRAVAAAGQAARVLVPAASEAGVGIFLVDPHGPGASLTRALDSRRQPLFGLGLSGASGELLGEAPAAGAGAARWMLACADVGRCALQLGVSERALEITTAHLREREQFGAPIGSFPAVQQRAADAFIDLAALRWTCWLAAWRLAEGLPASREIAVAKFWAAEAGSRIANTAQHFHAGLGVDVDYPIHRYFLWSKALELDHGSAMPQLARLGAELARSAPQEAP